MVNIYTPICFADMNATDPKKIQPKNGPKLKLANEQHTILWISCRGTISNNNITICNCNIFMQINRPADCRESVARASFGPADIF